jgi:hypothetical protein
MAPEERAEMRRAEKEDARDELLSWKQAVLAELNALKTEEEWFDYFTRLADMTPNERAELRHMTPEERAEMWRHDKAMRDEVLSWRQAAAAERNAMTPEERSASDKQIADEWNAQIAKVRAMTDEEHRALGLNVVKTS